MDAGSAKEKRMIDQAIQNFIEKKVSDLKKIKNEEKEIKVLEYYRALSDTMIKLKGSGDSDGFKKLKVAAWMEDYASVIVLLSGCLDPLHAKVYVIGLDGWTFTVNEGVHSALASDDPATVCAGIVSLDVLEEFICTLKAEIATASSKKGDDRHSLNPDGGHQKTPGFVLAKCAIVLNRINGTEAPNSGFTDVSMHTGCTKRKTEKPLSVSLIKVIFKFGIEPPVSNPEEFFNCLMVEYYLQCALDLAKGSLCTDSANRAMEHLQEASKYGVIMADSGFWPHISDISAKFIMIRKMLEDKLAYKAESDSGRYDIHIPNLDDMDSLPSPMIVLEEIPRDNEKHDDSETVILSKSKRNLRWIPSYDLKTLKDCNALLEDASFSVCQHYQFSLVLGQVEQFLYDLGNIYLKGDSNQISFCSAELICVVDTLLKKILSFRNTQKSFLDVELKSRGALLKWLEFCLLFEIGIQNYSVLSDFSPALDYHDMEHLVLKSRTAWDCLDVICEYLQRKTIKGMTKVFSGRENEVHGTLEFADAFVAHEDHSEHFNQLLEKEKREAQYRIDKRWLIIQNKQDECRVIRKKILDLEQDLYSKKNALNGTERYLLDHNYKEYTNPKWKGLSRNVHNIQGAIADAWESHKKTRKAPPYIKQPMPKMDHDAKRALFFCYMPELLRQIWKSSYLAQNSIFLAENQKMDLWGYVDYNLFYDGPYDFRDQKKCIRTPLNLFCLSPPNDFGSKDVESISSKDDGVWYASTFQPFIRWEHGNPFSVKRQKAVDAFTETISNDKLQWAVEQRGRDTPSDRGNLALSMLYQKPDNFTREHFLNFGDLRAFPLLQINNVLTSIKNMSLPFKLLETHQLIQSVFYHIGEISYGDGVEKPWKGGIYDEQFMDGLRKVMEEYIDRLKDAPKNHEEFVIMLEIVSFLSQFSPVRFLPLSDECSKIACIWANNIDDEIKQARNNSSSKALENVRAKQQIFLLYAALAYEMTPTLNNDQAKNLLLLNVRINSTMPESDKASANSSTLSSKLIGRLHFMLARFFHGRVFECSHLTLAARYIFPSRLEEHMDWKCLDGSYCFYTKNHEGYYISLNVLNGIVLLNGLPPGRLPFDILNHSLYKKVFGNYNFSTELLGDGTQKTINPSRGRYYSFKMISEDLVVYEEERFNDKILKLRLLDGSKIEDWGNQLPLGLKQLYSHWQLDDLGLVVIRSIHFMMREIYYLYIKGKLFLVPQEDRHLDVSVLIQRTCQYERMLHFDEPIKRQVLSTWSKFDLAQFIHVYVTEKRSFRIVFVRYRLSFELLDGYAHFVSGQKTGFKVRTCQLIKEILRGFHNYLVLESEGEKRLIIVPNHTIQITNGDLMLSRDPEQVYDIISDSVYSFNSFRQHQRFHEIEATDVCSRLQLASLFAGTSTFVPEEWIGMTGFEMSIELLRRCWVNRPLDSGEFEMLAALLKLNDLPPGLILIAHSLLENSEKLKFLYSNTANKVLTLDHSQYVCALNQYVLPSPRFGPLKNARSELNEEECIALGIISKPISHADLAQCKKKILRKSVDISAMEKDLFHLTSSNWNLANADNDSVFSDNEDGEEFHCSNLPFLIPKELPLFSTEIGKHMISRLESSFKIHESIRNSNLSGSSKKILKELRNALKNTSVLRQKLETDIITRIDIDSKREEKNYYRFAISWASNSVAQLTLSDMAKLSWKPKSLLDFNPMLTEDELEYIQSMVFDWMQLCVLEDRIIRAVNLIRQEKLEETTRELQTYRKYNVKDHPLWLALEVDQGIQIRPEQMDVIKEMLANPGSVIQLNVGLGKTRVILPCLFLEWSKRNSFYQKESKIVSMYLLSSLLQEGFTYFHRVLTAGLANKKLFLMPFRRDVNLNESNARMLVANYKYCALVGGAVIQSPEHRLSLHLRKFTLYDQNAEGNIAEILSEIDSLPFINIYDEVDEIMNPVKQLIYAQGHPELLHAGQRRWQAIFALLFNLRHHVLLKEYFQSNVISSRLEVAHHEYDMFQLLPCQALENAIPELVTVLAESLFTPATVADSNLSLDFPLDWIKRLHDDDLKAEIITFITDVKASVVLQESDFECTDHFNDLLVLRGLLGNGILAHCLSMRYNVNYGVVDAHKTAMAIPFRAANMPALRSEFSQPECSIGFTILSYYNRGLDKKQLHAAFSFLLQLGFNLKNHLYRHIYDLYVLSKAVEPTVDSVEKIDLTNIVQFDLLYRMYSKSMALINFWLSYVLFPTQTMIFPQKLVANSWDITDTKKSILQCGFSGTVDSCVFLPYPLYLLEAVTPSLAGTDGKMISHLIHNAEYASLTDISATDQSMADCMIQMAIKHDADAFIDSGALLCSYSNKDIAFKFLGGLIGRRFKGVVFFCTDSNTWTVLEEQNRLVPLETSPIHESEAFVIYDQSRCRGADMKLKPNAKAILTLGPKMRKEDLMQAAGRLRKLDFGQRLVVTTTLDVEVMLRDTISLSSVDSIQMQDVLLYTSYNSIKWVSEGLSYYLNQGIHFLEKNKNSKGPQLDELTELKDIYHSRTITCCLKENTVRRLELINCEKTDHITLAIQNYANQFGKDIFQGTSNLADQVERELEVEREMEAESELELPETSPAQEKNWNYELLLNNNPPDAMEVGQSLSILEFFKRHITVSAVQHIRWSSDDIYLTENFAKPLAQSTKLDDYLRPVRHGLFFPLSQKILLVSDREADSIFNLYLRNESVNDKSPILLNLNYLKDGYDFTSNSPYASLITKFKKLSDRIHANLELFSGETDLSDLTQKQFIETIIASPLAVDGASFFSDKRGLRTLFTGSKLEKTLEKITSKLFWERKLSCQNIRS